MPQTIEVKIPDIGDFKEVAVIEALVKPGDVIQAEDSIVTLESEKASTDAPSRAASAVGGDVQDAPVPRAPGRAGAAKVDLECDLLVLGAGPGGYSAAFRAADLGLKTPVGG